MKHILIIGAGFGGLKLARKLNNHQDFRVTLVDRNNFHQFQPLMYQVATANLDASNISFPLRYIFQRSKNVTILIAELLTIDEKNNRVETSFGLVDYDYLVIATGADTNYFGNKDIKNNAFPMKSTLEALQLRNQIILNFEVASRTSDQEAREKLMTMVIVGAGPTGVELSGALAEMKHEKLPKEYPELKIDDMKIYLLEGGGKVLGSMSAISSKKSREYLEGMGVIVKVNTKVENYDGDKILLGDGSHINSALVIWAAGVRGNIPDGFSQEMIAPGNRIKVDSCNRVIGRDNIFAIGDIAFMESKEYPNGFPQLANVAIDQAVNLANNINLTHGKEFKEYHYNNKGSMATIGRNKAVVDLEKPKMSFQGFFAWLIWMGLHLFLLMGFKNKLMVFINWVYNYFLRNQSLALLFEPMLRKRK